MSLFNDASNGTLTRQKLEEHLRRSPNINNTSGNGETALGLAIKNGHTSAVSLLLKFGANPATRNVDGRSPLYLVSVAPESKRVRLAQLLLNAGAKVDESLPGYGNNTSLMAAITQAKDPKLIHVLVEAGASLTQTNDRGESAKTLARDSMDPAIQRALVPAGDPRRAYKPELGNLLTTAGQFAAAYFGDWKDVAKDAVDRIAQYLNKDAALNEGVKELHTVEDFKDFLWDYIDRQGLEDFYPANDPRIQAIAEAAVAFRKKPELNALSLQPRAISPQSRSLFVQTSGLSVQTTAPTTHNLLTLTVAQLYTPVLYIDDSGSMGWGLQGQNDTTSSKRVDAAKVLVGELMDILSWVNPDAMKGIGTTSIRFINRDVGNADNLTVDQVKEHMRQMTLPGGTDLGTNLRSKILDPLIYNPINAKQNLRAPYLIMTIGDGVPTPEPKDTFRNEIVSAANFLKSAKYSPEAVKFTFSQIGTDAEAESFRNELVNNPLPDGTLYVSSDRFDQDYDNNKGNPDRLKANLASWLSGLVDLK